jgi:sulfur transfer complex TusBCD TusB component (DsrH family)
MEIFMRIVPPGDYYKKKDAVKIIEDHVAKKIPREKMLRLIELIPKKKSLYLATKEMEDRNIGKVMQMFAKINVSPVTLSKRHEVKFLKSLYSILLYHD